MYIHKDDANLLDKFGWVQIARKILSLPVDENPAEQGMLVNKFGDKIPLLNGDLVQGEIDV
jgi:hypothetical protein